MLTELRLCDMDDPEAAREAIERRFRLDGKEYLLDLCELHGGQLDQVVQKWARSARKVTARGRDGRRDRVLTGKVRDWALSEGLMTQDKGRIPEEVWTMYQKVHGS